MAIILTPFVYPALIINAISNPIEFDGVRNRWTQYHKGVDYGYGLLFNFGIWLFGGFFGFLVWGTKISDTLPIYKTYINGLITVVSLCLFIQGLILLIRYIIKQIPKKPELSGEECERYWAEKIEQRRLRNLKKQKSFWYLTKEYFIAWKDKNCPMITWDIEKK